MTGVDVSLGLIMVAAGLVVTGFEIVHPGAFLLIPGTTLLVAGFLYLFVPNVLLDSLWGPVIIGVVIIAAMLVTIPIYQHMGRIHRPMTTMPASMAGAQGLVLAPVDPDSLRGKVRVGSEVWSAKSSRPIAKGTRVRVLGGEGVTVNVEPIEPDGLPPAAS